MEADVKISVIMGVFNPRDEKQFRDSVDSIVKQTFQAWEMILYDDGSDFEYENLIDEVADLDSRIVHIRNEKNHGLAYALNQCISYAKGEFIARMDDDDISKPQRLERLYHFLKNHPVYAWVGSNMEQFDENGIWGVGKRKEIPKKEDFLPYSPYIHPAVMFRKNILIEMNGYKVSDMTRRCEDYELFMRLHEKGYQGYNLQENLLLYREDYQAYRKRRYKNRVREMCIRYEGFKKLGILNLKTVPYVIKPLAVGLIPARFVQYIKKNVEKRNYNEQTGKNQDGEV